MRKIIVLIIIISIQSCGWLDEKWDKQNLIDHFKLINDVNNKEAGTRLVLMDLDGYGYKPLIDNCITVYCDTTKILVESVNFKNDTLYTKVLVSTKNLKSIPKTSYLNEIRLCDDCRVVKTKGLN
ncbi:MULTISPECIES: hypothetical protein [Flavobacteriaceae]|uniref:hypothetical protein n=1 Tax=Flavobacteriaceae TaxID=49546 RepID=UPI0038964BC1